MKLACAWLSSKPHEEFTYDSNKWSLKDDLMLVIFHQSIGFVIWILFFESCHCDEFSNEEFINNKKNVWMQSFDFGVLQLLFCDSY